MLGPTKASNMTTQKSSPEIETIMADLRDTYVKTPRDALFDEHFNRLLKCDQEGARIARPNLFTKTGETRGVALIDGPGGGKTSLVDHALTVHPAFSEPVSGTKSVVKVRVPSPATLKSLALEILAQSGYSDVSKRRERWVLWQMVRVRFQALGTVVLWIDEAHDLFKSGTAVEIRDILNTLKSLMQGEGAVIVILSGIESLWQIASYDDQVKRRFTKLSLPPVSNAKDGKPIANQIEKFCARAGLLPPSETDLVPRLIYGSHDMFGRCIENILHAIEMALKTGAAQLEAQHFAMAWAMQEGCPAQSNVFLVPRWSELPRSGPQAS